MDEQSSDVVQGSIRSNVKCSVDDCKVAGLLSINIVLQKVCSNSPNLQHVGCANYSVSVVVGPAFHYSQGSSHVDLQRVTYRLENLTMVVRPMIAAWSAECKL